MQIWVARDAGHVGALGAHPAEWTEQVTAFLDAASARVPASPRIDDRTRVQRNALIPVSAAR